jgi:Tfp pilus assembly protein PilN
MAIDAEPESTPQPKKPFRLPPLTIALWLIVMSLAVFFVPLYLVSAGVLGDVLRLKADLQPAQATLTSLAAPPPESQEAIDALARIQALSASVKAALPTLVAGHTDWPAVMSAIGAYDPLRVMLTSLGQTENRITLRGRAADDSAVVTYARSLEESRLFARVVVQSIRSVDTPFATTTSTPTRSATPLSSPTPVTPTMTLTPTATITPTPDLRDSFEPDDSDPKDVAMGQAQGHNFYPVGDVDKVRFLAKSGRYYRVFTSELRPGVDTSLSVNVDAMVYVNDDRQPGDLSSEVLFQAPLGRDVVATVDVVDRGQYGADKWYNLTVQEIIPTLTPTPYVSATPTLTPAATATPDRRDAYEPDDDPRNITLGQPQLHNFFPGGDVDRVKFLAKAGRYYRVYTRDLAPGVDTALTVLVGGATYSNDDRPGHQPNDHSSEVVFLAGPGGDVEAVVTVMNRGQDGPDATYQLGVEEVAPTPVPTVTPTPDLRDNLEPDDGPTPPAIFFGQAQLHNFYPEGDVDRVSFLAKAGHFYRVGTSGLAAGVDTILTVTVGPNVYTNDDRQSGDLSSLVMFGNEGGADMQAIIEVRNRGGYGPDKLYTLTAEELSDPYEPDVTPRPIAVGETQTHSFFPVTDVDKVVFLAKAGRTYRVYTSGLSLGVDTLITVTLTSGGTIYGTYANDDRVIGDPASEVQFRVGTGGDVDAVVEMANRGQFGPDKQYRITVEEIPPTPAPAPPAKAARGRALSRLAGLAAPAAARQAQPKWAQAGPASRAVEFVILLELKARAR